MLISVNLNFSNFLVQVRDHQLFYVILMLSHLPSTTRDSNVLRTQATLILWMSGKRWMSSTFKPMRNSFAESSRPNLKTEAYVLLYGPWLHYSNIQLMPCFGWNSFPRKLISNQSYNLNNNLLIHLNFLSSKPISFWIAQRYRCYLLFVIHRILNGLDICMLFC